MSHNPLSNLKLHNGVGPIGKMLKAGVNVALGTDGSNSGDEQSLAPVIRLVACLARLNGLQDVDDHIEEQVMTMATDRGHRLWFPAAISSDSVEYRVPVDPLRLTWCDCATAIKEVHIDGKPVLEKARALVAERRAYETVSSIARESFRPEGAELVRKCVPLVKRYSRSI